MTDSDKIQILNQVRDYARSKYQPKAFVTGEAIPVTNACIGEDEIVNLVDTVLKGWFTEGEQCELFLKDLLEFTGNKYGMLVNSGSSANLIAVTALKDQYQNSDYMQVLTAACVFPTTVAPIIQNNLQPTFFDLDPETFEPDYLLLQEWLERSNVAGIILAHTLGFPYDERRISDMCRRAGKWFVSDCCDALGATVEGKPVGSWANCSTYSFFPAHHITTGEGGAILTRDATLRRIMGEYVSWGKNCWCSPGQDNSCGIRFGHKWKRLPFGYDHKYVFSKVGYNLKMTELQGALGHSQAQSISQFVDRRRENFEYLLTQLSSFTPELSFIMVGKERKASSFGFPILVNSTRFSRDELVMFLEQNNIRTRPVFSGNLTLHPMFDDEQYDIIQPLVGSNEITNRMFWVGVWPGLQKEHLDYIVSKIEEFVLRYE